MRPVLKIFVVRILVNLAKLCEAENDKQVAKLLLDLAWIVDAGDQDDYTFKRKDE